MRIGMYLFSAFCLLFGLVCAFLTGLCVRGDGSMGACSATVYMIFIVYGLIGFIGSVAMYLMVRDES